MADFQLVFIHGGSTFNSRDEFFKSVSDRVISLDKQLCWNDKPYLEKKLPEVQIIRPTMPCKENARYDEWKLLFDKFISELTKPTILVGFSLGGIFLTKYLSENKLSRKLLSVYFVAPPFDDSLPGEDLVGGFELKDSLNLINENSEKVYFMFSSDDNVVPLSQMEKYEEKFPKNNFLLFDNVDGHFRSEKFEELIDLIKNDIS